MSENEHSTTRRRQMPRGWWLVPGLMAGMLLWIFIIKGIMALLGFVTG